MTIAVAKTLDSKAPAEIVVPWWDFTSELGTETIAAASQGVTADVANGVDASPGAILSGSPTVTGSIVYQYVTGGLHGVDYHLVCTVTTSAGRKLVKASVLPVRNV